MTRRLGWLVALGGIIVLAVGCDRAEPPTPDGTTGEPQRDDLQWKLPKALREISGLALTPDQRLLAVNDEIGVVFELDYGEGRLVGSFGVGEPPVRGDFEGIAVADDVVYLITSTGQLLRTRETHAGTSAGFTAISTGLASVCEIEGLAYDTAIERLWIACKQMLASNDGTVSVFAWDPVSNTLDEARTLRLNVRDLADAIGRKKFNPSAIALLPDRSGFALLTARRGHVTLDWSGRVVAASRLSRDHPQSEGLAITADGRWLIADEAGDKGKGRLAVYRTGTGND